MNRKSARHGYIARGGQMVDASIVQAPKQSPTNQEKATVVVDNAMPTDWSPPKRRQKDLDARWPKKHSECGFGCKLPVSAYKRCRLIRKVKVSTASEHYTLHFEAVIDPANTSRDVYADQNG